MQRQEYLILWNRRDEDQGRNTLNAWEKLKIIVRCLSRDWILDNHPSPRPTLYKLSYKQRSTPHVTWNTCLQKNIVTNKAMPLARTEKMRSQRTMARNNAVYPASWHLCCLVWALEQTSDGTVCSCNSVPQTHFGQRMRDLVHTFTPLYSGFLKRTSWLRLLVDLNPINILVKPGGKQKRLPPFVKHEGCTIHQIPI